LKSLAETVSPLKGAAANHQSALADWSGFSQGIDSLAASVPGFPCPGEVAPRSA